MNSEDRELETKQFLYRLLNHYGTVYTLGLCIGILARLSKDDWNIYHELKVRADELVKDPAVKNRVKR